MPLYSLPLLPALSKILDMFGKSSNFIFLKEGTLMIGGNYVIL